MRPENFSNHYEVKNFDYKKLLTIALFTVLSSVSNAQGFDRDQPNFNYDTQKTEAENIYGFRDSIKTWYQLKIDRITERIDLYNKQEHIALLKQEIPLRNKEAIEYCENAKTEYLPIILDIIKDDLNIVQVFINYPGIDVFLENFKAGGKIIDIILDDNYEFNEEEVKKTIEELSREIEEFIEEKEGELSNTDALAEKEAQEYKEYLDKLKERYEKDLKSTERIHPDSIQSFIVGSSVWLHDFINSPEYYERLKAEGFLNPEKIKRQRIKQLKIEINLIFDYMSSSTYQEGERISFALFDLARYPESSVHERGHSITKGVKGLSEMAINLYAQGFDKNGYNKLFSEEDFLPEEYIRNPSELDARRLVLIKDLEKIGVWEYGEPFTEEIYEKVLQADKEGKLTRAAHQFFTVMSKEIFITIMNTLA